MEMDDNENFIDYQKMNFPSFASHQFNGGAVNNVANQIAAAKFAQNLSVNGGQVLGLVSGPDGEVHYLNTATSSPSHTSNLTTMSQSLSQQLITLPITMPGAKPGDAQQTVQIQVVNPNAIHHSSAAAAVANHQHLPIQNPFQQGTTVLTVAYAPQDGDMLHNHGLPEGMTVVAAIQPQDLHLLAQAQAANYSQQSQGNEEDEEKGPLLKSIKQEPPDQQNSSTDQQQHQSVQIPWQNAVSGQAAAELSEYIARLQQQQLQQNNNNNNQQHQTDAMLPVQLNQFLKFNAEAIKREASTVDGPQLNGLMINCDYANHQQQQQPDNNNNNHEAKSSEGGGEVSEKAAKKKRKYKKKPPKPKRPKPGQVHIATALDGTVLFCCPECHRAYPEKENLEQHLTTHKIERRFICDICGAGLKRKEHLERHKLGHNPDRPYVCSVCLKGFKRKEHLNLHFVIHSGEKTEICGECGKGFYRKDHLRKHAKSHALKRQKELTAQAVAAGLVPPPPTKEPKAPGSKSKKKKNSGGATASGGTTTNVVVSTSSMANSSGETTSIPIFEIPISSMCPSSLSSSTTTVTASVNFPRMSIGSGNTTIIHIPTGDNTTLPVQIQLPHMLPMGDHMTNNSSGSGGNGVNSGGGGGSVLSASSGQSNELPIMGS